MGFQALLTREDYYGILKNTLQRYYSQRYGTDVVVGYEPKTGSAELVMNPRLGMIFMPFPPHQMRRYLYRGYNIRGNILKNVAAKAFVFVSTHTRSLFTMPRNLYVYPAGIVKKDTMIAYLNRSIRVFEFNEGLTVSIQKESFTSKFFQNQLQFRLKHGCDYIPPIVAHDDNWFEERILKGISLARETNKEKYRRGECNTYKNISTLIKQTLAEKDARAYLDGLISKCMVLISKAKKHKECQTCEFAIDYLNIISLVLKDCPSSIPVALSHGDLQAGNIWLEGEKVWIIDWETVEERSIWFDFTTLHFGTRYYGGIKQLVSIIDKDDITNTMTYGLPCEWDAHQMLAVFLLEDLVFYLEDMMELPKNGGSVSFDRYIMEVQEINWHDIFKKYE